MLLYLCPTADPARIYISSTLSLKRIHQSVNSACKLNIIFKIDRRRGICSYLNTDSVFLWNTILNSCLGVINKFFECQNILSMFRRECRKMFLRNHEC